MIHFSTKQRYLHRILLEQMYIGLMLMKARINVVFLLHCVQTTQEYLFYNNGYLQNDCTTHGVGQLGTSTPCFSNMAKERNKSLHPRHAKKGTEVSVNVIPVPKPSWEIRPVLCMWVFIILLHILSLMPGWCIHNWLMFPSESLHTHAFHYGLI